VTVIIPTYNRKDYLQEAIDSVLAQTYAGYEVIVIDDGSTDGTRDALSDRYGDRIRYVWQQNRGESAARNRAIRMAQGEYIALLDSDDLWFPEKLARQVPILDRRSEVNLVFSQALYIDREGRHIAAMQGQVISDEDLTPEALCLRNSMASAASTALVRRRALELVDGYDERIRYGEDFDLFLRLRLHGPFAYLSEPLGCRRLHSGGQYSGQVGWALEQRVASRLRSLDRAFDRWPGQMPPGLRERAVAHCYYNMGLLGYRAGRSELAQRYLDRALDTAPGEWDTTDLLWALVGNMVESAFANPEPAQAIIARARNALDHWPTAMRQSLRIRSRVLGQTYAGLASAVYGPTDPKQARYCWLRAVGYDPTLLRHRWVWPLLAAAMVGTPGRALATGSETGCGLAGASGGAPRWD
jgi:glycosyltransferase involved in cell wall biosynthesis